MADDTVRRVTELEAKVAHQDQTIEELSDMVTRQWQAIDKLERQLRRLNDQIVELEDTAKSSAGKEAPPPHY